MVAGNYKFQAGVWSPSTALPQGDIYMAKAHVSHSRTTDKTIRAIDRKREQERRKMFMLARDNSETLATKIVQRLIDRQNIETTSVEKIQNVIEKQLRKLVDLEEFDLQLKLAPVRTLVQDPNIVSLYFTQFVIEDLIEHDAIHDIYGEDLDIYRTLDSVLNVLRH